MGLRKFMGGSNAATPAVNVTKKDPKIAAVVSKATPSIYGTPKDADGNRRTMLGNTFAFRSVLQKRARRNSDNSQIQRLLPDIELSKQILVSSILSPKDMSTLELIYMGPKNLLAAPLQAALLNRLKQHFEETYKIRPLLTEMTSEPLFDKGSYPVAVIPENAIDDFINSDRKVTMEALKDYQDDKGHVRLTGVLGPHVEDPNRYQRIGIATEAHYQQMRADALRNLDRRVHYKDDSGDVEEWQNYAAEDFLVVVDNPNVLKFPKVNARTKAQAIKKQYAANFMPTALEEYTDRETALEFSMEAFNSTNPIEAGLVHDQRAPGDADIERAIYRHRNFKAEPVAHLKRSADLRRRTIGNPLIMKLPSESVIPVHVPGNVKQHIGYFVVLDEEGNPVEVADGEDAYKTAGGGANVNSANALASNLIRKVESNLNTGANSFDPANAAHMELASRVYSDLVERDLLARVKNGVYGSTASLARNEDIYRIMLSRVLARKYTQVLYVPAEFMTYIAFDYGDDGVGRSLLDETATINTLRTVLLFSDIMGSVKNSIGRTKVTLGVPEHDPNPLKLIDRLQDEVLRSRQLGIPMGVSSVSDIFEFVQRAGIEWEITGHPGLPDVKLDFQQVQSNYQKADSELTDLLRKAVIMAYGLSPETVDNGFNTEFATTALANNLLLAKRVVLLQDILTPQISDHLRKVAVNSGDLVDDLKRIITEQIKHVKLELTDSGDTKAEDVSEEFKKKILVNRALQEFLSTFYVELPRPASITLEHQLSDMNTYSDILDKALDAYISDQFFNTTSGGDVANEASTVRAMVKAYYMRKWMADKGILTELSDLVGLDEEGLPRMNLKDELTDHVKALIRSGVQTIGNLQPIVEAANRDMAKLDVDSAGDTGSFSGGGGGFGGGGGGGFGGGDFGGGLDFGDPMGGGDPAEGSDPDGVLPPLDNDDLTIPSNAEAQGNESKSKDNPL